MKSLHPLQGAVEFAVSPVHPADAQRHAAEFHRLARNS